MSTTTLGQEVKDWIIPLIAVVLAFFIRYFIVELYMVEAASSMRPTLVNGERLVVNKFIYRFKEPELGDAFSFPLSP